MEDAAAAATGGDWRSQIDPMARQVVVKQILKTLRWHLPLSGEEGRSRLQNLAKGYELRFYKEATNKVIYKRKIAMLLMHVMNKNRNSHRQAPGLPPQGNDPAQSSGVPLMSLQETRRPKTSTSVQDSYLPNRVQSLTGGGQVFTLQNIFGQSTIPHMQSAIQSGTQQNPSNIGWQPMKSLCQLSPQYLEEQLRHPQLSMNQQPSLQCTWLTQEPNFPVQQQQQESMGQQPNLHQIQLIYQQNNAVDMQQQHRLPVQSICPIPPHPDNNDVFVPHFSTENFGNVGFAVSPGLAICHTSASGSGNPRDPLASVYSRVQLSTLENNEDKEHVMPTGPEMETDKDSTFSDELHTIPSSSQFSVHGAQDGKCKATVEASDFNVGGSPFYAEHLFTGTEISKEQEDWAAFLFSEDSSTQMENSNEEEDWAAFLFSLDSGTQMENSEDEVPNFESMDVGGANPNKRKFDHISSWAAVRGPSTYSEKCTISGEPAEVPKGR